MIMKRIFLILMIVACALISPVFFYTAQGANNMTIQDACAAIGLDPGEAPFAQCVQSLQRSASLPDSALAASKSESNVAVGSGETRVGHRSEYACRVIGLDPATARYSYCVTNLRQTLFETSLPGYQN
jgi:hypothetical protein